MTSLTWHEKQGLVGVGEGSVKFLFLSDFWVTFFLMQNPELFWGDMSTIIDFEGVNIEKITHFEPILSDFQKSLKLHYCEFDVKNHSKSIILKGFT